jgi:hypothetical protein
MFLIELSAYWRIATPFRIIWSTSLENNPLLYALRIILVRQIRQKAKQHGWHNGEPSLLIDEVSISEKRKTHYYANGCVELTCMTRLLRATVVQCFVPLRFLCDLCNTTSPAAAKRSREAAKPCACMHRSKIRRWLGCRARSAASGQTNQGLV